MAQLTPLARVCAYDRAGMGWSDAAPLPRDAGALTDDAVALLTRAGIDGPLILIGHSYGGALVRRLAARLAERVVGIVLVDASDAAYTLSPAAQQAIAQNRTHALRLGWAARFGLLRVVVALWPDRFDPLRGTPADLHAERLALYLRTARHFQEADDMAAQQQLPPGPGGGGELNDIPVIIISRPPAMPMDEDETAWQQAQRRLVETSSARRHHVARQGGHIIQADDPETIVDAVRVLLERR